MIREALGQLNFSVAGYGTVTPSPAGLNDEKRKGMDWEKDHPAAPEIAAESKEKEKTRMDKLGGFLGSVGSILGHHLGFNDHKDQAEIMIGMFMHTPWPSSEIFRCLPS